MKKNSFIIDEFIMHEDAPFYYANSKFLFLLMMYIERLLNSSDIFSWGRMRIQFAATIVTSDLFEQK